MDEIDCVRSAEDRGSSKNSRSYDSSLPRLRADLRPELTFTLYPKRQILRLVCFTLRNIFRSAASAFRLALILLFLYSRLSSAALVSTGGM